MVYFLTESPRHSEQASMRYGIPFLRLSSASAETLPMANRTIRTRMTSYVAGTILSSLSNTITVRRPVTGLSCDPLIPLLHTHTPMQKVRIVVRYHCRLLAVI